MDSNMLTLKWERHNISYLEVLSSIRQTEAFSDATIACDGKFFNVHKLVMSSCSDYLRTLFEKVNIFNSPIAHPVIILQGVTFKHLEALLDYMYLGEVNILQSELASLIKAAEILQIKGLAIPDKPILSNSNENKRTIDENILPDIKRHRHDRLYTKGCKNISNIIEMVKDAQQTSKQTSKHIKSFISNTNSCAEKGAPSQSKSTPIDESVSGTPDYLPIKQEISKKPIEECSDIDDCLNEYISFLDNHQQVSEHDNASNSKYYEQENSYVNTEPNCSNVESNYSYQYDETINIQTPSKPENDKSTDSPGGSIEAIDLWLQLTSNKVTEGVNCPLCTIHCKTKGSFLNHYKSHTGDLPYGCPHCRRRFVQRISLKNHIKTHTGERPFACSFCPRRFIQKKNLKNHMISHTGKNTSQRGTNIRTNLTNYKADMGNF
ncbi:unnamed protein product [Meganyctiphanes norvegica]|uniref:Uncharacterized protein n=1 Tax=Meganyctiphanes norvegica TaxID=48144 RepID=A0AAV2S2T3_MEGNR